MRKIKILLRLFSYGKIKTLIILFQIILSVYFLTFFLTPLIKNFDSLKIISNVSLDNKALYIEAYHARGTYILESGEENYNKINDFLNKMDNIKSVSGVQQIFLKQANITTLVYDAPFCYEMKLPLSKGEWLKEEEDVIPIIVSYDLRKEYPLNKVMDLEMEKSGVYEGYEYITKKVKVVGILEKGGYVFVGGTTNSFAGLSDWFIKLSNKDSVIILPNLLEMSDLYSIPYPGRIIEYKDKETLLEENSKEIELAGMGNIHLINDVKKNDYLNIFQLNSELIYKFVVVFIFIIASIGGYNTLATIDYRRRLTIYYINGLEWKKGILFIMIKNLVTIILPTIIASLICNNVVSQMYGVPFDSKTVFLTVIIYASLYLVTSISVFYNLNKIEPIAVLKEVE